MYRRRPRAALAASHTERGSIESGSNHVGPTCRPYHTESTCRGSMPKVRWLLRWDDGSKVSIVHDIKELKKDPSPSMIVKCFCGFVRMIPFAIRSCSLETILRSILVICRFQLFSKCSIEKLGGTSKTFRSVIVRYCP